MYKKLLLITTKLFSKLYAANSFNKILQFWHICIQMYNTKNASIIIVIILHLLFLTESVPFGDIVAMVKQIK